MSLLIKVSKGTNRPEGFINANNISHAWIEPCYKTDRATFDLSNQIAMIIEKDIEKDPYAIADDKKLYAVIEQGIEEKGDTEYLSVETKIALRLTLFDRYRKRTSTDYRLVVGSEYGAKLEVAVFHSQESAAEGLKALMDATGMSVFSLLDEPSK